MKKIKLSRKGSIILLITVTILAISILPPGEQDPISYVDRESGYLMTEKVAGEKWLIWLYHNPVGEATLWTLVKRKMVSSMYGEMMSSASSVEKIEPFVEEFAIDLNIAKKQKFNSFNDFFTRKLIDGARPFDTNAALVISPADGKIMAWKDLSESDFIIKGYRFDVYSFLNDSLLANEYEDGSLLVIRLAPPDYHRFHFPLGGKVSKVTQIDGDYYSVNPIALREMTEIFCLNKREYVSLSNRIFGEIIIMEVGATMVGTIIQTYNQSNVVKGQEKGYFEFGGSTVVLLFKKDEIIIDEDLLVNTKNGFETSVKMGERIGVDKAYLIK